MVRDELAPGNRLFGHRAENFSVSSRGEDPLFDALSVVSYSRAGGDGILHDLERDRTEIEEGGPPEMKKENEERERIENDVDKNVAATWGTGSQNRPPQRECHNLDIEKGGATIRCLPYFL